MRRREIYGGDGACHTDRMATKKPAPKQVLPALRLDADVMARLDALVAAIAGQGVPITRPDAARMAIEAGLPALEKKWKV